MYVCMYICMYPTYVSMYLCMYPTYVSMYLCTCMYVRIYQENMCGVVSYFSLRVCLSDLLNSVAITKCYGGNKLHSPVSDDTFISVVYPG